MKQRFDILIAGGGTAGAVAAISAARNGMKVLVAEKMTALGGSQTFGMVTPFMDSRVPQKGYVASAVGEEIRREMVRRGYCEGQWFDPGMMKAVLEEKVLEAGAEILYETDVIGIRKEGKRILSADIFNSDGIGIVTAEVYADCTGDAMLAKMAGLELMSGNRDGINQSASLRFEMANVDVKKFAAYLKKWNQPWGTEEPMVQTCSAGLECCRDFREKIGKAVEEGRLDRVEGSHIQMFSVPGRPGIINFNCPETGAGRRVSSAAEKTRRLIAGRKSILRIARFMKEEIPGFEDACLNDIAAMLGIRESERIYAEYEYGINDILCRRRFEDAIFKSAYPVDVHGASTDLDCKLEYVSCPPKEAYFEYPYRALVPKGIDNLLVCGRCAGCDFYSHSAVRVQFSCQAMGEAAGFAAKLATENGIPFREVDGVKVRKMMLAAVEGLAAE